MKNTLAIFLLFLCISCKKETSNNNMLLARVTVNGKVNESFEYNSANQLVRDNSFNNCSNPSDEFYYIYKNNKLDSLKYVLRSLYSSTAAICDPLSGIHYYSAFEYDSQGRINRITKNNSTVTYNYNSSGLIDKQTINGGGANVYVSTYKYDTNENLIEVTDGQGLVTKYEFDTKINPYYLIKRHPDIITAFLVSPNNVIRIINAGNSSSIKYAYNSLGLPVKMIDPNGLTYDFVYQ